MYYRAQPRTQCLKHLVFSISSEDANKGLNYILQIHLYLSAVGGASEKRRKETVWRK